MRNTFALGLLLLGFNFAASAQVRVGLVLDQGGRDDKSFNASAFKGAKDAESKLGIQLKDVVSPSDSAIETSLRMFAQMGYQLVIGIGVVQADPLKKVAAAFPKTHFLIVDAVVEMPNVASVMFKEHEGAYLVGALAALTSKTGHIGFIGGMDIPLIRRFLVGYAAGAKSVNPSFEVAEAFVDSGGTNPWRNPTRGKELALGMYKKGSVDVIFAAAGASGLGVFDAADEQKKLVIGVDSNQNCLKRGRVLTSMLKRVDNAVYRTIQAEATGKFTPGRQELGIVEGGVDYAIDACNRSLVPSPTEHKLQMVRQKIINKQVTVPDHYETLKSKKG